MSTDLADPGQTAQSPRPAASPARVRARAAVRRALTRPRQRRSHGPVGLFLTSCSSVVSGYVGWHELCRLHGEARVLTAGSAATAFLIASVLWRRGWLG